MKAIDRDGFVSIPNGKPVRLLIAESVLRFVQRVATKNGATKDNGPYRSHLSAARDGRQLDDPLVAVELTLGPEKGN